MAGPSPPASPTWCARIRRSSTLIWGRDVTALLELVGVRAGYGGGDVLLGVDLKVEEGALTCIVGPNGAGKSTVLRVISGLLPPAAGSVRFRGESIARRSPRAILPPGIVQG